MEHLGINQTVLKLIKSLKSQTRNGVSFISIRNYENSNGEVANHLVNLGVKYENAIKSDIAFLEKLDVKQHSFNSTPELVEQARIELIESFLKPNENKSKGQTDAYTYIGNGIKVHNKEGHLFIHAFRHSKTIITEEMNYANY